MERAAEVRAQMFGFAAWRGEQETALRALAAGRDALVVMPTGSGKSLIYQVAARVLSAGGGFGDAGGLTLVVSPLIALMQDQLAAARRAGLRAEVINSSLVRAERERVLAAVAKGEVELLYATPERFRQPEFEAALSAAGGVRLLAIDEAHCISTWGHDFRLDYSRLGEIRTRLGRPQCVALTATATRDTQDDILNQLGMVGAERAVASVWRGNLAISVHDVHGVDEKLRRFVFHRHARPGASIVYFALVQSLEKFANEAARFGEVLMYHGQLPDRVRRRSLERFLTGDVEVMLATPAFGLGIDKPDVRLVMHAEMPGSMEAYYQEIGRAGRDGEAADVVALFDGDDVSIQRDFLKWATPEPAFVASVHRLIERHELRARQEGYEFLRSQMNFYNRRDFRVETSVALLERWGVLEGLRPRDWRIVGEIPQEFLDEARDREARARRERKLLMLESYMAEAPRECRWTSVAREFGESGREACGVCDACLAIS